MGVIVEVQRARDDEKRFAWPMYAAALHVRLRCPVCLVVIATDEATARWAATPIITLQYGGARNGVDGRSPERRSPERRSPEGG